jgi:pilus assembly protein CpaF
MANVLPNDIEETEDIDGVEFPIFDADMDLIKDYGQPIEKFFDDPAITSVCVNRFDQIYIRKEGKYHLTDARFKNESQLVRFIQISTSRLKQKVTEIDPIADARMPDGSRINAVLFPVAHNGSNMTIRLFPKVRFSVDDLLSKGMYSAHMLDYMRLMVAAYSNVLVAGASGSGKTTLLNALANLIPRNNRTIVIEDTAELKIDIDHVVGHEAPHRKIQDAEPITMERLLINVLRQEPERIIIGEIRDPRAATALQLGLNTGNRGVMSTLHANNAEKALRRLETLLMSNNSGLPYEVVRADIRDSINVVVYAERTPKQGQRVVELAEIEDDGSLRTLWRWDYLQGKHIALFEDFKSLKMIRNGLETGLIEEKDLHQYA